MFLEAFAILGTHSRVAVSQLACGVVCPPKAIVAECSLEVNVLVLDNTNFELVFSACVCNDLPIVRAALETNGGDGSPEQVVVL